MIENNGFRYGVGIILMNSNKQVLLCKRIGQSSWQFPQGGIDGQEKSKDAMYRELYEEVGLSKDDVQLVANTKHWLSYKIPKKMMRKNRPSCIGQKQKWFLLKLRSSENEINLTTAKPEFDDWKWVNYWHPLREVIYFKQKVYSLALKELAPFFWGNKNRKNFTMEPLFRY